MDRMDVDSAEKPTAFQPLLDSLLDGVTRRQDHNSASNQSPQTAPPAVSHAPSAFDALLADVTRDKGHSHTSNQPLPNPAPAAPSPPPPPPSPPPQPQPPANADSLNPFYHPALTLGGAARHIHRTLDAALCATIEWNALPEFKIFALATKRQDNTPMRRMCLDLEHVSDILRDGRDGWELVDLPHAFYENVLPIISRLMGELLELEGKKGCMWMREKGLMVLGEVEKQLRKIRGWRMQIEEKVSRGENACVSDRDEEEMEM